MLFLRFNVASLVKEIHKISSGLIFNIFTKYTILPIIVRLLPEPAPAITKIFSFLDNTTFF